MAITIEKAELEVIPKTGYYTSTSEFLKDAMKTILAARKDLRILIVIELYKKDPSLGRVAEIADIGYEAMKELLVKSGIEIRRGTETVDELENGARMMREFRMKRYSSIIDAFNARVVVNILNPVAPSTKRRC